MDDARGDGQHWRMRNLALVLVSALLASRIGAQPSGATDSTLRVGTRVRVRTADASSVFRVGTVSALSADSLELRLDGADSVAQLPYRAITQLDVSGGRHRHTLQGAGIGVLVGVTAGVISGFASGDDPPGWFSFTAEDKAVIGGTVLGVVGLAVGAVVGGNHVTERWLPIRILPRVSLAPRSSVGFRVTVPVLAR